MLDKDKVILVVYIGVEHIDGSYVPEYMDKVARQFAGSFDESVKILFVPRWDTREVEIKNLVDIPEKGIKILKKINKAYLSKNDEEVKKNFEVLNDFVKAYTSGTTSKKIRPVSETEVKDGKEKNGAQER